MADMVELKGGLLVTERAFRLANNLERRGHRLKVSEPGVLTVSASALLEDEDIAAIKADKFHLLAIVGYDGEPF